MCSDRPQSPSPDRTWRTQHSFLLQKWGTQVLAPSLILSTLKRGSRQEHRARRSSSGGSRLHPNCTVLALASFSVSETVMLGDRRCSFHHGRGWRPTFIPHQVCHLHPMAKTAPMADTSQPKGNACPGRDCGWAKRVLSSISH